MTPEHAPVVEESELDDHPEMLVDPDEPAWGAPMTPEQIAEKGAFVRVLREYADRANDNFSQKVAVPEHVLRDAAACIEDQRAHIDKLTTAAPEGTRLVLMAEELALELGADRVEWGEPDEHGWYSPTLYKEHR